MISGIFLFWNIFFRFSISVGKLHHAFSSKEVLIYRVGFEVVVEALDIDPDIIVCFQEIFGLFTIFFYPSQSHQDFFNIFSVLNKVKKMKIRKTHLQNLPSKCHDNGCTQAWSFLWEAYDHVRQEKRSWMLGIYLVWYTTSFWSPREADNLLLGFELE